MARTCDLSKRGKPLNGLDDHAAVSAERTTLQDRMETGRSEDREGNLA
jgi:hypothetical protein